MKNAARPATKAPSAAPAHPRSHHHREAEHRGPAGALRRGAVDRRGDRRGRGRPAGRGGPAARRRRLRRPGARRPAPRGRHRGRRTTRPTPAPRTSSASTMSIEQRPRQGLLPVRARAGPARGRHLRGLRDLRRGRSARPGARSSSPRPPPVHVRAARPSAGSRPVDSRACQSRVRPRRGSRSPRRPAQRGAPNGAPAQGRARDPEPAFGPGSRAGIQPARRPADVVPPSPEPAARPGTWRRTWHVRAGRRIGVPLAVAAIVLRVSTSAQQAPRGGQARRPDEPVHGSSAVLPPAHLHRATPARPSTLGWSATPRIFSLIAGRRGRGHRMRLALKPPLQRCPGRPRPRLKAARRRARQPHRPDRPRARAFAAWVVDFVQSPHFADLQPRPTPPRSPAAACSWCCSPSAACTRTAPTSGPSSSRPARPPRRSRPPRSRTRPTSPAESYLHCSTFDALGHAVSASSTVCASSAAAAHPLDRCDMPWITTAK